ncbi:hypothetical protein FRC02_000404 [Tulasnella sp. 418]|nr:hypothetical protein FRC02_000404 [Tulasnella sp. 418]
MTTAYFHCRPLEYIISFLTADLIMASQISDNVGSSGRVSPKSPSTSKATADSNDKPQQRPAVRPKRYNLDLEQNPFIDVPRSAG